MKAKRAQKNPNLSESAQLPSDRPVGYKLYISVSNAKSKRLCTHQQATEPAISLIVSRHRCLGSGPWCLWCHCFLLMIADMNSKATLKRHNIAKAFILKMGNVESWDRRTETENTEKSRKKDQKEKFSSGKSYRVFHLNCIYHFM